MSSFTKSLSLRAVTTARKACSAYASLRKLPVDCLVMDVLFRMSGYFGLKR